VETGFPDIRQQPFSTIQQGHLADFPETGGFMQPVPAGFRAALVYASWLASSSQVGQPPGFFAWWFDFDACAPRISR
jgi:hypothetical protein